MPDRRADWASAALFPLFAAAILFGAWTGFPVYDDAYVVQFLREVGANRIAADLPHRPVEGWILQSLAGAFGLHRGPYVAVALAFWLLLAWQTSRLWRRFFPEDEGLGTLAGLLVLAPILVATQYSTLTTVLPINLPVSLGLAALLLCLRPREERSTSLAVAAILIAFAVVLSDYGLAISACAITALLCLRRFRPAIVLAAGAAVGFVVYRLVSNPGAREDAPTASLLGIALGEPVKIASRWVSGLWHALLGAWMSAVGRVVWEGRSGWASAAAGLVTLALALVLLRRPRLEGAPSRSRFGMLAAIVGVGLIPVVLALRTATSAAYGTRFRTPILPFAAIAIVALFRRVRAGRFARAPLGLLAFVAGYWVVYGAFEARRSQQFFEAVGTQLVPLVRGSEGVTAAVLPGQMSMDAADMTPKATLHWSDAEAKRAWLMSPEEAEELFGPRTACRNTSRIDTPPRLNFVRRTGALSHLVWVPFEDGAAGALEDYCVGAPRSPGGPDGESASKTSASVIGADSAARTPSIPRKAANNSSE